MVDFKEVGGIKKAVLLLSGGLDSAVCLYGLHEAGAQVYPLFVSMRQKAAYQEARAARLLAEACGSYPVIFATSYWELHPHAPQYKPAEGVAKGYIPGRNNRLASMGYALACELGADTVVIGANGDDHEAFPDCRPSWVGVMQAVFALNNRAIHPDLNRIRLVCPLLSYPRAQIREMARLLKIPMGLVWSCYTPTPQGEPCGECESCKK